MDKNIAASAVRKYAIRYEAFMELAAELDRIGSLERAEGEAKVRLDAARKEVEEVEQRLKDSSEQLRTAEIAAVEIIASAKVDAEMTAEAAKLSAESLLKEAESAAKLVLDGAQLEAQHIALEASQKVESVQAASGVIERSIVTMNKRLEEKGAELADLEARIEAAKQSIRKFVA